MTESSRRRPVVAIVGGGFSGAATAFHLLRQARAAVEVVVVEPAAELGRGLAYSTRCDSHCLNVPAGRLGLDPAQENGFGDWLAARGHQHGASSFVPRHLLGGYVGDALARAAVDATASGARLSHVRARVDALARDGAAFELRLSDGSTLRADRVVLATGHLPPTLPSGREIAWSSAGMVPDPWRRAALEALPPLGDVLLVGSGLTAIDVVMQLDDAGHRGQVHLLSRRGLLPQPHRDNEIRPAAIAPVGLDEATDLRGLLALIRDWAARHAADGGDWRDAMASLRAATPRLWQGLAPHDRRRFLRHLQPFWDTHRHRVAAPIARRVQALREAGRVTLHAGRLVKVAARADGLLAADWRPRGADTPVTLAVARLINCTGPTADLGRAREPLLAALRDDGSLSPDALGQGLLVDDSLRWRDASGHAVDGAYYVGPMLKAQRWEAVAIPELRVHARNVARHLLQTLASA